MRIRGVMALAASAAIVVGACSSNGGSTAPSSTAAASAAPTSAASAPASGAPSASAAAAPAYTVGEGEGALNLIAWAGYVVGGTGGEQVTGYDWVTPFEKGDRLQGHGQGRSGLGEHGPADEDGPVRRRLRVRRRDAPTDRGRRRRAGRLQRDPQLRGRLRGTQEPVLQHRQRRRLRCPARSRRQRPDVRPDRRDDGAGQLGPGVRSRLALQGKGHGLQLRDLHRRCRALPDEDAAGA